VLLSLYLMSVFFVGTLLLIVPGLIAMAGFAVAAPVVAVEETAASRALLRSWELTRGRKRRAFALVAVTVLPMLGLGFLPAESVAIELLVSAAYCTFATYADIATWLLYQDLRSNSLVPEDRDPAGGRRAADVV
jgi:phosphoglycerol transferase MdoB-like AlkP superfamily enzyme